MTIDDIKLCGKCPYQKDKLPKFYQCEGKWYCGIECLLAKHGPTDKATVHHRRVDKDHPKNGFYVAVA